MKEQEIERDMKVLIERMRKDDKGINACIEYGKLYDSVTYLECLGYIELSAHHTDDFELFRDYRSIARIRAEKINVSRETLTLVAQRRVQLPARVLLKKRVQTL